ncbi:MAG: phytoene/squalene synthase family protein [Vulcanimicrobiaceae bacterium]
MELEAADAYCRVLARRHYENFVVASRLVRHSVRRDLVRIYAFCRTTDDLGDESSSKDAALARLQRWRDETVAVFAGTPPVHPVLVALLETIECRGLPAQPFLDLIAANVMDQHVSSYATWADLEGYCRLSAAPVGRMVLRVFGIMDPAAPRLSDDVCIGLQLANHAQDVKRDASIGRSYLPDSEISERGLVGAVRSLVERARGLLASGRELETMVCAPLRAQLALYRLGGLAICDAIEQIGFRTDRDRPYLSRAKKFALLARALLPPAHRAGEMRNAENR